MAFCSRNKAFAALAALATLGGCADYLNNWDAVSFRAGDAKEANSAIHVVHPFPPYADNTNIPTGY